LAQYYVRTYIHPITSHPYIHPYIHTYRNGSQSSRRGLLTHRLPYVLYLSIYPRAHDVGENELAPMNGADRKHLLLLLATKRFVSCRSLVSEKKKKGREKIPPLVDSSTLGAHTYIHCNCCGSVWAAEEKRGAFVRRQASAINVTSETLQDGAKRADARCAWQQQGERREGGEIDT
jgi:hypothetical protein